MADNLTTASSGSIQVRVYEPGKLVPPFDILDSVSDGKVAAGYTWIGYDQGKVPAVPLFAAVPFGMKPWAYIGWYYYGGGEQMLQDVYANKGYNVHAQLCGIVGPETAGWYKNKIESLDDYKGMKLRFAGLGGKVLEKLRSVTEEVLKEEAAKDADFKKVYESQKDFMETYKVWDQRAYLPADMD